MQGHASDTVSPSGKDEQERLRVLRSYRILDTPDETEFDDLTRLAARLCGAAISTLTLIDERRLWFKSVVGLADRQIHRHSGFCESAILGAGLFFVPDSLNDSRFRQIPMVTGAPHLRFYAGMPLISADGAALGTLCVMDRYPRHLTQEQQNDLQALARQAMRLLESHRQRLALRDLLDSPGGSHRDLRRELEHLAASHLATGMDQWELDIEEDRLKWMPDGCGVFGLRPEESPGTFHAYLDRVHADDRERLLRGYSDAVNGDLPLDMEHRILRPDGEIRYVRLHARRTSEGGAAPARLTGRLRDVTVRRHAEFERQALLDREQRAIEAARNAERLFRAAFDNVLAGVGIADSSDRLIAVNARFCEMLGYSEDELKQMDIQTISSPNDWPRNAGLLERLKSGIIPYYTHEKHLVHRNGRRIPVQLYVSALPDAEGGSAGSVALILDRTDEVAALEQLRRSQWLMRIAGKAARLGGWYYEVETDRIELSEQACALFGLPPGTCMSLGRLANLVAPEWRSILMQAMEQCLSGGVSYDLEFQVITPDGRKPWIRGIGQAECDAAGNRIGVRGAMQDISEVRNARAEVVRIANRLRTTLESITDGFFMLDHEGRFTYLNREAERLLGRGRHHALGRPLIQVLPDGLRSVFELEYPRAIRENVRLSAEAHDADTGRWIQVNAYPSTEGLAVYLQDVTGRHQAQEKLASAWDRTRRILETSLDVIALLDRDARFFEVNSRCQAVWGYSPEELTGTMALDLVHPEDREIARAAWAWEAQGEQGATFQTRSLRHDGAVVHVHWSSVWSAQDQLHFVVARDVTVQVEAEERARQSQRLEAIGQLTGGVAHDFNNLLTVVLGSSELLAAELSANPRLAKLADMIRNAALRGADLTRGLLAYARRQTLAPVTLRVPEVIERIHALLRRTLSEAIEIEAKWSREVWPVIADPGQLEAALLNLCLNARDAMPQGGRLTIEAGNVVLDESYVRQHADGSIGECVVITVTDNGIGMEPDVLRRAFDPFFTTKDRDKGTGLGLSMVYGFARQSGGHVRIESDPAWGTSVRLYIPRSQEKVPAPVPPEPESSTPGQGHILVVEDDDMVREFAAGQLVSLGYQVTCASNGAEAMELVNQGCHFDLLFTDVIMPGGINGPQLARNVLALRPGLPVLLTSGYPENAIAIECGEDSAVQLLHKPYSGQGLAARVRDLLADDTHHDSIG